jgi:hypothetical protein
MTFTDIQNEVADRLNLTSTPSLARIGRSINERYRWLASSIGFDTIERTTASASTSVGNRVLTFGPSPTKVQKLLSVFNPAFQPPNVLDQVSFDEMRNQASRSGNEPRAYAIQLMGSDNVTIMLDQTPTAIYSLSADVMSNRTTLSGTDVPAFAEDYHDALVYGAMATELKKMEKYDLAKENEDMFFNPETGQGRVADLRLFIAKSAYMDIYQGRRSPDSVRWTPLV